MIAVHASVYFPRVNFLILKQLLMSQTADYSSPSRDKVCCAAEDGLGERVPGGAAAGAGSARDDAPVRPGIWHCRRR